LSWEATIPYTNVTVLSAVAAAVVLVVGLVVVRIVTAIFKRSMRRTKLSDVLVEFLGRFFSILLYVLLLLLILSTLGVSVSAILVSLSAVVGLILGFGMQDTINNIASGTWIAALRPIDIGEVVTVNGMTGKVRAVGVMATELLTVDNQLITIPNGQVWGSPIINATRESTRMVQVPVGIAYGSDIDAAVRTAIECAGAHALVLGDPAPFVRVGALADSSVNLELRAWVETADYWTARDDLTKGLHDAFRSAGIEIPFPQLDVHMEKQ
jgi:small-conductance mechanosensitive channel